MKKSCFIWCFISLLTFVCISLYAVDGFIKSIGKTFPEKVGNLVLVDHTDFENKTPGLGESLSYRAPGINADLYVYDFKIKDIPDGADSEVLKKHFAQVAGDIFQFEKMGKYKNVKTVVATEKQTVSGMECLWEKFSFNSQGKDKESYLYLTGYKGKFFKIRVTHDAKETKFAEETANFASKVFEIIGKKAEDQDKKQ